MWQRQHGRRKQCGLMDRHEQSLADLGSNPSMMVTSCVALGSFLISQLACPLPDNQGDASSSECVESEMSLYLC